MIIKDFFKGWKGEEMLLVSYPRIVRHYRVSKLCKYQMDSLANLYVEFMGYLGKLPPHEQEVIKRQYIKQEKTGKIMADLHLSPSGYYHRQRKARRHLVDQLNQNTMYRKYNLKFSVK
ncbi:hypothetical protein EFM24_02535 [Limosilactobacillus fermentum]|uniref:hypothetical protein n=1 Tax=Limosilactobacillus fermentum TaxID=1613 RepID=UPI0021A37F41|nr:hypothetical protein [Limosilactobacillus fermentum]MCT2874616.1 hypothetical protein [Limosilactobacillus fermentum]